MIISEKIYPIVGAKFHPPATTILNHLAVGTRLILRPDPSNRYDSNAIEVRVSGELLQPSSGFDAELSRKDFNIADIINADVPWMLGFVPKDVAKYFVEKDFGPSDRPARFVVMPTGAPAIQMIET